MAMAEKTSDLIGQIRVGTHWLIDAGPCPPELLDDLILIEKTVIRAVEAAEGTLLKLAVHKFEPQGVTAFALLSESHLSLHTWPEIGFFASDLLFCGDGKPERAMEVLQAVLKPERTQVTKVDRVFSAMDSLTSKRTQYHE